MRIFLALLLLAQVSVAQNKTSLKTLNHDLDQHRASVYKFAAQIKHLEKKLGETNNTYLEKIKLIEKLENKVQLFQKQLSDSAKDISDGYLASRRALNLYLLEKTDMLNDDQLINEKIYFEVLSKKLKSYETAQSKSNELLEMINLYEQKLTQTKANEEIVYNLIVELENQKKEMSQAYIDRMEQKNSLEEKIDKKVAKQKAYKKVYAKKKKAKKRKAKARVGKPSAMQKLSMLLPLKNFVSSSHGKKSLHLHFKETTPVQAPNGGEIVHTGELGSYGQVIIIDHGDDIRSVLLGDLKIKVKRGDRVKEAQIIAYTLTEPGIQKTLSYQIRKKDIVQNTLQWISNNNKNNLKI